MLMPKAKKFNARQTEDAKQRFSIRKYSFGATSVLLGFSFMLLGAGSVSANTNNPAENSTELVADAATNSAAQQTTSETNEDSTKTDGAASPASSTTSTENTSTTSTDTQTASASENKNEAANETSETASTAAKKSTDAGDQSGQAVNTEEAAQTEANTDGQNAEEEKATPSANTESTSEEKGEDETAAQAQQTKAKSLAKAAVASSDTESRLVQGKSLTLSTDEIGYTSSTGETTGTRSSITATVSFTGEVGDKFTLKVPRNVTGEDVSVLYGINYYTKPSIADTTLTQDSTSGYYYVTSILKEAGSLTQNVVFTSVKSQMSTFGDNMIDSASIGSREMEMILSAEDADGNNLGSVSETFTQIMKPTIDPELTRTPDKKNQATIQPNKDYTYSLSLNELLGINNASDVGSFSSNRVMRSINYGTEIRIPVPAQFELNASDTALKNAFGDQTTITQDGIGADVVITVPKGSGNNVDTYDSRQTPYYIVGKYVFDGNVNQTVTADSPITITQYLDDAHTKSLTGNFDITWSENVNSEITKGNASLGGYGAWIGNELVLNDKADKLTTFFFGNLSSYDLTDVSFDIKVADGFNATGVTTPKVDGTSTYRYVLTYADGTTSSGTVNAGEAIKATGNSPIREAVLTADYWKAGAKTDGAGVAMDSNTKLQRFTITGNLSETYDDGSAVKTGDSLTNSMTVSSDYLNGATRKVTQKIVPEYMSSFRIYESGGTGLAGESQKLTILSNKDMSAVQNEYLNKPVIYVVLPQYAVYNDTASKFYGDPAVSTFYVNDGANQVVKLDYSNSDYQYNIRNDNYTIVADISDDALPGTYQSHFFVKTTTKMMYMTPVNYNTLYKPEYTEGDSTNIWTNNVVNNGFSTNKFSLTVLAPSEEFTMGAMSEGNLDTTFQNTGKSFSTGVQDMKFKITPKNLTKGDLTNVRIYSNLPTESEVKLTGPVTTTDTNSKIYYSTSLVDLNSDAEENVTWLSEDEVTDWSTIKSIKVQEDTLAQSTPSNQFSIVIPAKDVNLAGDVGKTLNLGYKAYADQFVTPIKKSIATSVIILGPVNESRTVTRTINVHLPSGEVQTTKQVATITRTGVMDKTGNTTYTDWTTSSWSEFSNVPDVPGYTPSQKVVTEETVNSDTTDVTIDITYTGNTQKALVNYVDGDKNNELIEKSDDLSGESATAITYSTEDTIKKLEAAGYVFVSSDYPTDPVYDTDDNVDQVYTVVLKHRQETVSQKQKVTRTVVYQVPIGFDEPESATETLTFTRTGVKDTVTGEIKWNAADPQSLKTVTSPKISGLTADKDEVASEEVTPTFDGDKSSTVVVVYTPNIQNALVNYVDEDLNKALITTSGDLTGLSKNEIDYTTAETIQQLKEAGYVLVSSDYPDNPVYDSDDDVDQVYTVVLKHGQKEVSREQNIKRTVVYEVPAGFDTPESVEETLSFTQTGTQDLVTGKITWKPVDSQSLKTVTSPKIAGLTADKDEVASEVVAPTFDGDKETTVKVVYTPNIQNALVKYVDEDKNYELIEDSGDLSGLSKDLIGYSTEDTIKKLEAAGYVFVSSDYPSDAAYDTDDSTNQIYTVVLKHGHQSVDRDQKVKRTVVYEVPAGFDTPESVEETLSFTQTGDQDLVTKEITWKPVDSQNLKTVTSPKIAGLTADKDEVASEVVAPTFDGDKETTVKVVYTPNIQNALVKYVDADKNYELIEDSGDLSGLSKELIGYSTEDTIKKLEAAGYVFVSSDYPSDAAYDTDDSTNQIYTVVLKHGHQSVDRDQKVKRTVVYEVPAGFDTPESVEETLSFTQSGDQDLVTGTTTWNSVDPQSLKTVTSPTIPGLTPDKDEVASQEVVPTFDGDKETTVKVVYTPNIQNALVKYVDEDKNYELIEDSGDLSGLSKDLIGYSTEDTIKKLEAAGYVFVSSDYPTDAAYDTDDSTNQIYTVVLKHGHQSVDRDQNVKRTVVYEVPAGFDTPESVEETLSFTQTGDQDLVTKEITWKPVDSQSLKTVTSPTISGLTPDKDEVASQEVVPTFDGDKETTVKVVYTPNSQNALVKYVDADKNNELIEDSGDLSGLSKDLIGYSTEDTIKKLEAAGYVFVSSDYPIDAAYDTDDSTNQIYTVVLKHGQATVSRDQKVTQNVVYEVPAGFETPSSVSETVSFTQSGVQDLVTKEITWKPVDSQSLKTVTSPTISGLTPDKDEVASQEVVPTFDGDKETTVKVVYTPNSQNALVKYVDADKNNELIEDSGDLSGLSKDLIGYSTEDAIKKLEAAGYVFVSSDYPTDAAYDTDDSTNQIYTVVLKHGQATVSRDQKVTQNVVYEVPAGFETPSSVSETVSFTQSGVQDLVTKEITWKPVDSQSLKTVTSPTISGLTPDKDEVASQEVVPTFDGDKETTVKVVYTADKQKALVNYVDADKNNELIEDSGDLSGLSKDLIGYSTEDMIKKLEAAGYVFVSSDYPTDAAYDTDDSTDQIYTVVLKHGQATVSRDQKVTQNVVYEVPAGFETPSSVSETVSFTQSGVQDLVTKEITWKPVDSQSLKTVTTPTISGLTPDKDEVASQEVVPTFDGDKETTVKVIYTANKQKALVNYVDADKNNELIEDSGDLSGLSKDLIGYSTEDTIKKLEAAGYVFVSSDYPTDAAYDNDDNTDQVYTVVLKHQTQERVNTMDAKQTVHYVGTGLQLPDKVQTQKDAFKQVVVVDLVTGKVVEEGPWTGQKTFGKETVSVINGYHSDKKIAGGLTATPDQPEVEETVTYVPNGRVILVDKNGQQLPGTSTDQYTTDPEDPTKVLDVVVPEVKGYQPQTVQVGQKLTPSDPSGDTYIVYDVPTQPVEPSKPTEPTKPETPVEPTTPEQPTVPSKPETPVEPTTPDQPTEPTKPETPVEPTTPDQPTEPTKPETPVEPTTPDQPTEPTKPETPVEPTTPDQPTEPTKPETPVEPTTPDQPTEPTTPETPVEPSTPDQPTVPSKPVTPEEPAQPEQPSEPTTPETPVEPATPDQPTVPSKPVTPEEPAQPEQPSVPSKPATPAEPKTTEKTNTPASPVVTASQTSQKTSPSKKLTAAELPQTGSDDKQSSEMTLLGAILLGLSAATAFVTGKKRKKD